MIAILNDMNAMTNITIHKSLNMLVAMNPYFCKKQAGCCSDIGN